MENSQIKTFRQHLRKIEREVLRSLKDPTTCCGVTLAQCHALLELEGMAEPSLAELSEVLGLDASTLSRTVDGLVKTGLLRRTENPQNRRSVRLSLTDEGRAVCTSINAMCDEFYRQLIGRIPAERHPQLLEAVGLLSALFAELRFDACAGGTCCEPRSERRSS